jgi:hypothetical protein
MSAEQAKSLRSYLATVAAFLLLAYAAVAAGADLWILYRVIFLRDPWEPVLFLIIPGLAALSILLAWFGFRLLRDKDLPERCARACRAFFASAPDVAKPSRHAHDLD